MADDQAKITIVCSRELKRKAKKALLDQEIDSIQDGFLRIFELGLSYFTKNNKEVKSK